MAQFQFEQELASAVRLDSTIHVVASKSSACASSRQSGGNDNSSLLLAKGNKNRSRSESRLHPGLFGSSASSSYRTSPQQQQQQHQRSRSKTPTRGDCGGDRFIPNRSASDHELAQHAMAQSMRQGRCPEVTPADVESVTEQLRRQKMSEVLNESKQQKRILAFRQKAPAADEAHANTLKVLFSTGKPRGANTPAAAKTRQVSQKPEKVLDAPDMIDDFYLHLIDWSSHNHLAVALSGNLFVWNASDGSISELFIREEPDEYVSSVRWVNEGNIVATALAATAAVELWDTSERKLLRVMSGHSDRVGSLDWNDYLLASGCKDGEVHLHDVRVAEHKVGSFNGHTQEVCGLAWSPQKNMLATGANDNLALLWDHRQPARPLFCLNQHQSAVKAMAWCPWQQNTLATGGGTSDRTIKFWNASTGNCVNSVDSGSQVSSLLWNSDYRELLSAHGFSHNQLSIWSYPKMTKVSDLQGHTSRILKTVTSPDGSTVASAAADETIRLWKLWPLQEKKAKKNTLKDVGAFKSQRIR